MLKLFPSPSGPREQGNEAAALRTLNAFAVDLMSIPNVDDLFWYVTQNVVGRLKFVDCVIYQADDDRAELTQVAAWGEKNPFGRNILNPLVIPYGNGITGKVAQMKKAIIVDDLSENADYIHDTHPARSEICVPLLMRGRVIGVIDSEHPEPNAFGRAELEILTTVAAMTSAKLELLAETQKSNQRYHELVQSHAQLTFETSNRKALEAKLFEARKLESIGRLTGKFAHEFNNLLTVISGNLEFLETDSTDLTSLQSLRDVQTAAEKGAQLIRDMLVFAQRTRLNPATCDLNRAVTAFCASGDVTLNLTPDLWPVLLDQKAMGNALTNLLTNAREAMGDGGQVVISTANIDHMLSDDPALLADLAPGRYVRLSISDTGKGIAKDRLSQIFDPFFTTKPVGAGTGLGLSMVLGFVQQTGGTIIVNSETGVGSTFHLYFPALPAYANDLLTVSR